LWHFIGECNYKTFDQVKPEVISSHFFGEHPSLKSVGGLHSERRTKGL
jgi:hypothetical protein